MGSRFENLPEITDYTDSPLPAWKHYGIMEFATKMIQEELDTQEYSGYLVGLQVQYEIGTGDDTKKYSMSFGRVSLDESDLYEEPLSQDFMIDLYSAVSNLVHSNMPEELGEIAVQLHVAISGSLINLTYRCHKVQNANECNQGHVGLYQICAKVGSSWSCQHTNCS